MPILEVWQMIFSNTWAFFTETPVPGFENVHFSDLFLAILLIGISLAVLRSVFGLGGEGTSSRSGSARNPKISDARKGDEF